MRKKSLILSALFMSGCASSVAKIEIVDRPNYNNDLFRYVLWQGEKYSPVAFKNAARHKASSIVLVNATPDGVRCAAALSGTLSISASTEGANHTLEPVTPSREPIANACVFGP